MQHPFGSSHECALHSPLAIGQPGNNPDPLSGSAYLISGGTLSGSGTITTAGSALDGITITSAGRLAPGTNGTVGTMTFNLGSSTMNLAQAGSSSLLFDIGATAALVAVTGSLTIDNLGFDHFAFTELTGITASTYTLFSSTGLNGTLDNGNLSGAIGTAWPGTPALAGNDIQLTVSAIPEPLTTGLITAGTLGLILVMRRRRSQEIKR